MRLSRWLFYVANVAMESGLCNLPQSTVTRAAQPIAHKPGFASAVGKLCPLSLLLRPLRKRVDSFLKEAQTVARLVHPHIVRVLEFGLDGQTPFLVMDYATGGTLRQRHHRGTLLPLSTVVSYVKQATDALQYAHDKKFIHRDIKPENRLVGERDAVLLSDFGIALIAQSSRYQSTQDVVGTVAYMSPEQIQGRPRPAGDQYSLGIVVYEWLTGDRPFHGSFIERSGEPEAYDKHMAIYYADVVMSLFESGTHGVMAAYRDGAFISTDIPGKNLPARRVNPADYHTTRYRPRF